MRINGHTHIFTLQQVLSEEALAIMVGRLRSIGPRDFIIDSVREILDEQLRRPEHLTEDELLERFLAGIVRSDAFENLLRAVGGLPFEVRLLGGGLERLGVDGMRAILDRLSSWIDENDGPGKSPFDVFEALRLGMLPDSTSIADRFLAHLGPDDALVALMMDITSDDESDRDRRNFLAQLGDAARAAVYRPGRVLPFVAINTRRANHSEVLQRAVEELGFPGVKLYPSLGYRVDTPEMKAVLDYCVERDVPVLMHCTAGGFNKNDATAQYCDPAHWKPLLGERPNLRICFAHFGGWGGFSGRDAGQAVWAKTILDLMRGHEQVYADLSYHVDMMHGGPDEEAYFRTLGKLIEGDVGGRIIFGTDSWLVRLNLDDAAYWRYFEDHLSPAHFERVATTAPAAFLSLPSGEHGMRRNMARHVQYLEGHADGVGAEPAAWLRAVSDLQWTVTGGDPGWSDENPAHVATYRFFKKQIPRRLRRGGFKSCTEVRLRQLNYFQRSHEAAAVFRTRVQGNAMNLVSFCTVNGATFEGDYDEETVFQRLCALLEQGDRTLAEFAASLDAFFAFRSEIPA